MRLYYTLFLSIIFSYVLCENIPSTTADSLSTPNTESQPGLEKRKTHDAKAEIDSEDEEDENNEETDANSSREKREQKRGPKVWDRWSKWSKCSVTCGTGKQTRWRHCVSGGCMPGEKEAQIKTCIMHPC
ncbi:hypothetical protein WA026_017233 [Henosepilachna vigintioctopunctata]|uniref:Uncharacterized protein n=1 Tax=Henosepilachna vigintioctopunctata TaxID=420089 RepID=A0AAW1UKV1_9CUCU